MPVDSAAFCLLAEVVRRQSEDLSPKEKVSGFGVFPTFSLFDFCSLCQLVAQFFVRVSKEANLERNNIVLRSSVYATRL